MRKLGLVALSATLLWACVDTQNENTSTVTAIADQPDATMVKSLMDVGKDYHSFANPDEIRVTHLDLDLTADFDAKKLNGQVTLSVERQQHSVDTLVLDTRELTINQVTVEGEPVEFRLSEADEELGSALTITLPKTASKVTIEYATSPDASGVQWLTPAQTAGKKHPFLFTQAQAVHARSFIPLQDSPQVRVTYDAIIRTPEELRAVMSASNDPDTDRDGEYKFTMPQPIPSYLIALAIGNLEFKAMGERTGVYAEPEILDAAAKEFEDTEAMLEVTEKTYGPYSWERYDLLILPPSFPFGGMENPRLSFITPTVIAGDKSLVSLIAHELAHSWSGNTVTNATWRDLWLNEGFTTYLTYRIMEMVYGKNRFKKEAVLGYQDLEADIEALDSNDEILAIDLRGRNPDDVFSNIPYEKGALFLRELEQKVGRDNFDEFLREYFKHFAFKSITTDEFIDYLDKTLLSEYSEKLDRERINQWIFEPGIPDGAPQPHSNAFNKIDAKRTAWLNGKMSAAKIDTHGWTVHEWLYFLNNMPGALDEEQLAELDKAFSLTNSKNNEIAHSWLLIAVKNEYKPAYSRLYDYLVSIGRNKLVKPLYRELSKTAEGKAFAKKAFEEAKPGYHPLTVKANEGFVN
ncbi:M1 family metallopeptidase [Alteromonas sp. ASW11-130]|uniref:M1 family metallopeptidase n=1 Tax=Alteromonas sp. ASW11-130 TaxID=3015775 RepID=UPI002242BD73|nr:M1 family metallopeptidase [Alteromonas sp. ASW11-130]MCW8091238.1 M1 family metallopeptidase [Alteromonas sp. ASW11-130]